MRTLNVSIRTPPELGADPAPDAVGHFLRIPRVHDFRFSPDETMLERNEILDWCAEQAIEVARLDCACRRRRKSDPIRVFANKNELEWDAFIIGDDKQAVIFKTRWG